MKSIVLFVVFFLSLLGESGGNQWDPYSSRRQKPAAPHEEISILFVGDLMMGGRMVEMIRREGVAHPFKRTKELLRTGDLAFCNLEAPFGTGGTPFPKKYTFLVPPEFVEGLLYAGFDGVSLANNHTMDYGMEALHSTLSILDEAGIRHSGAGKDLKEARKPALFEVKGIRVAFLSYSNTFPTEFFASRDRGGSAFGRAESIRWDIHKAKRKADIVVVSFHWGGELENKPKKYMKRLAHLAIREGADCVVGHHPHTVQGIESYKKGIIAYSLGNFAFGSYSEKPSGMIFKVVFTKKGWKRAEVIPLDVNNFFVQFQPRVLEGREGEKELNKIEAFCNELGTVLKIENGIGIIE